MWRTQLPEHEFTIRTMTIEDMSIVIDWAAKAGWNPGINDAACYFKADPNGFLIGLLNGKPIAAIAVIKYSAFFGFLGFYIVIEEYRGQGFGIKIWNAGLKYLEGLNIGLDGVVAQQDNYLKSGFKPAYRNIRFEGVGGGTPAQNINTVELSTLPFDVIDAYDQAFFPEKRSLFTQSWINQPQCHALGVMQGGKLSGYGVMRKCRNGFKIAPLFADSPELAETIFLALKSRTNTSEPIFLDTPEINDHAVALAEKYSMKISFETTRMYTCKFPELPFDRLFGVASFEIG